ncbi:autotransporter-associated beta strand repeat-containing protein [Novosphingobium sp. PASSN1]|uniref:autotransporter-associated beta strand repeat-containing protein n=1 Tax=Novosphingobium sp. PASSN1 TaxID=2015561 RepID=UPI0025FAC784|nr:autotransporter-associated beta strand repeat-containing protein [Novosphingobium sp. PASSN1]
MINAQGEADNVIILASGISGPITLGDPLPRLLQNTTLTLAAGVTLSGQSAATAYGLDIVTGKTLVLPGSLSIAVATSTTAGALADRTIGIGNSQIDDHARTGDITPPAPIAGTVRFDDRFSGSISVNSARTGNQALLGTQPIVQIGVAEPRFATGIEAASVTFAKGFAGTLTVSANASAAGIETINGHVFENVLIGSQPWNRERIGFGDVTFGAPAGPGSSFDGLLAVTGGGLAPDFLLCAGSCRTQPVLNAGDSYGINAGNVDFTAGMAGTIRINSRALQAGEVAVGQGVGIASQTSKEFRWYTTGVSLVTQAPTTGATVTFGSVAGKEGYAGIIDVAGAFNSATGIDAGYLVTNGSFTGLVAAESTAANVRADAVAINLRPPSGAGTNFVITGNLAGNITGKADSAWGIISVDSRIDGDVSGLISADARDFANGWFAGDIIIGGNVTQSALFSARASGDGNNGYAYAFDSGDITVGGNFAGQVIAEGYRYSYGFLSGSININGEFTGLVSATGTAVTGGCCGSTEAMRAFSLNTGGRLAGSFTAQSLIGFSYGLDLTVSTIGTDLTSTITATSRDRSSYGIYVRRDLTVGGDITGTISSRSTNDSASGISVGNLLLGAAGTGTISGSISARSDTGNYAVAVQTTSLARTSGSDPVILSGTLTAQSAGDAYGLFVRAPLALRIASTGVISAQAPNIAQAIFLESDTGTETASVTNLGTITGDITFEGGADVFSNSGLFTGTARLGDGNDQFVLTQGGRLSGLIDGGAGVDRLDIAAGAGGRTLTPGQFTGFETIRLNPDATGRLVLSAAPDPATTATLDAGNGPGTTAALLGGELNLRDTGSSLRAAQFEASTGTLLSGNGTIFAANSTVAGRIAPGNSVGQLSFTGNLALDATSLLSFELGAADVVGGPLNDLIIVNNNLTLNGALSVSQSAGGNFTAGVYRLINYGGVQTNPAGTLTGADVLPNGLSGTIQTAIGGQVNLVVTGSSTPVDIGYWDGVNLTAGNIAGGRGGTAVWNAIRSNWTTASGNANAPWDSGVAVFGGSSGTVTVDGLQAFEGLQFVTGDYRIITGTDGGLTLGSGGFIFVDTGLDATIATGIAGTGGLAKQGLGRLILTSANTYAGGTALTAGTLAVGNNTALGTGALAMGDATTLQAFGDGLMLGNAITLAGGAAVRATIDTQTFTFGMSGAIAGAGQLSKTGSGTLALTGSGNLGSVQVEAGTLQLNGTANLLLSADMALGDGTSLGLAQAAGLTATSVLGSAGVQTIRNIGSIAATINLGDGNDAIDNSGRIDGSIALGGGDDALTTRGIINGNIDLGSGANLLSNSGMITGAVRGGDGVDQLDSGGDIMGPIDLAGGNDALTTRGTIRGDVALGSGANLLSNSGTITGAVQAGDDNDQLDNGGSIVGTVTLAGGDDVLTNRGILQGRIDLGAGQDRLDNSGSLIGAIELGTGDDSLVLRSGAVLTGTANGGSGNDRLRFEIASGTTRVIDGGGFQAFEMLEKGAGGTLQLATGALAGTTLAVEAGNFAVANTGSLVLSGAASLGSDVLFDVAAGGQVTASDISGDGGSQTVRNAGTIIARLDLGAGDDVLTLSASGTINGTAQGGLGRDRLAIDVAAASARIIDDSRFLGFDIIQLNPGGSGDFVLTGMTTAGVRATLDAGDGSLALLGGGLLLRDAASAARAATVTTAVGTRLSGIGTIIGETSVAGTIAPGSIAQPIGTLRVTGNYTQTGVYALDYRAPRDLGNIRDGRLLARSEIDTPGLSSGGQDADLLLISGSGRLAGSVLLQPLDSAASYSAALATPGNVRGEIRYNVLRASGGLGGTRFAVLTAASNATLEYPNATDVQLVLRGTPAPIVITNTPPPPVTEQNRALRNLTLSQNLGVSQLSIDCLKGNEASLRLEGNTCLFGSVAFGQINTSDNIVGLAGRARPSFFAGGIMQRASETLMFGTALAYRDSNYRIGTGNTGSENGWLVALLASYADGPVRGRAMVSTGFTNTSTSRISLLGEGGTLSARYNAPYVAAAIDGEYWRGNPDRAGFAFTLGLDAARIWRDRYTETGTALDVFAADQSRIDSLRSRIGILARQDFGSQGQQRLQIEPRLVWNHEFGDIAPAVTGRFTLQPDVPIASAFRGRQRDSLGAALAALLPLGPGVTMRAQYDLETGQGMTAHGGSLRLTKIW